ncbi:MAG: hypothetical protein R2852_08605 [Bacteroidia bacterium]
MAKQFSSVYCIIIMIIAILHFKRWPMSFNVLVWIGLLLPLSAGSVISFTRYSSSLFPYFTILGKVKSKKLFYGLVVLFSIFSVVVVKWWVEDNSLMF